MINRHPEVDMLVEYAAGSLATAPCIAVTAHLQFCKSCSDSVKSLDEIGGELLATSEAVPLSGDLFSKILDSVESLADTTLPAPRPKQCRDTVALQLPEFVQRLLPAGELDWRRLSSSLKVATVSVGEQDYELALHRIDAGGKAPEH